MTEKTNPFHSDDPVNNEVKTPTIDEILSTAVKKIDKNFEVQVERNKRGELALAGPLSDDEMEEEHRHRGNFVLPEREGMQTLEIHFLSTDPYVDFDNPDSPYAEDGPDAIVKFTHSMRALDGDSDMEIAYVYTIRKTPDGDMVLEKRLQDYTMENKNFNEYKETVMANVGHEAVVGTFEDWVMKEVDRKESEKSGRVEAQSNGFHLSDKSDFVELQKLIDEAEIRR